MIGESGGQKQSRTPNIYCDSTNKHKKKEVIKDLEHLFILINNKYPYKGKAFHSPQNLALSGEAICRL